MTAYDESQICFLLEITWDSIPYRFSSFPVEILDGVETYSYNGGLNQPDYQQASQIQGFNLEAESIPFELIFDSVDFVQERIKRGRMLDNSAAELSFITVKNGQPVQQYDNRIILFKGVISQPLIGDPTQPKGHVTFSVVQGRDIEDSPLRDSNIKIRTNNETISGKTYPIIIGSPGSNVQVLNEDGNIEAISTQCTPAYLISETPFVGSPVYLVVAGHPVEASTVMIRDYTRATATLSITEIYIADIDRTISVVDVFGTVITPSIASEARYYCSWKHGGGLSNPFSVGELSGGGDIIRYFLESLNIDIDFQAWEAAAPLLNAYKFDGYINQPVNTIEFLENEIVPYLPVEIFYGPKGVKPILALLYMNQVHSPRAHVIENPSFRIISAITSELQPADIINSCSLDYAWQIATEGFSAHLNLDPTADLTASPFNFTNQYAELSENRFGLKKRFFQSYFIQQLETAVKVLEDTVRLSSLGALTVLVRADISWGYLEIGDIIELVSEDFYLQNMSCMIVTKSFQENSFLFTLRFEDNPLLNRRPYD